MRDQELHFQTFTRASYDIILNFLHFILILLSKSSILFNLKLQLINTTASPAQKSVFIHPILTKNITFKGTSETTISHSQSSCGGTLVRTTKGCVGLQHSTCVIERFHYTLAVFIQTWFAKNHSSTMWAQLPVCSGSKNKGIKSGKQLTSKVHLLHHENQVNKTAQTFLPSCSWKKTCFI